MTLSTRLWLLGAALPVVVMAMVLAVADAFFHAELGRSLDRALLSQAAVESVSLFDGPDQKPHLHMAENKLTTEVRAFAPEGTLFGPEGTQLVRVPAVEGRAVERIAPPRLGDAPRFVTVGNGADERRELWVTVERPESKDAYALRLSASLGQVESSSSAFHLIALAAVSVTSLVLVSVQLWQGRRLRARLALLSMHLEGLQRGELDQPLPRETERDEVSALRDVLASATAALKRAQAAQERLLADAAHELKTPLSLMRTNLDLALRRERPREELLASLADTREEVDRLTELATRLLDTVAVGKGETERAPTDLAALARTAVEQVRAGALVRGVTVRVEAPSQAMAVVHGPSIRQAVDNLLSNALKFSPSGSEVVVGVKGLNAGWALSVRDQGPGIAPTERENIFEPFHRVPGAPPGTGLGLTIVREVARRHGGRAVVADAPRGAEVVLELPNAV